MKAKTPFIFLFCIWNCISAAYSQFNSLSRNQFTDYKAEIITVEKPARIGPSLTPIYFSCHVSHNPREIVSFKIVNLINRNEPATYINLLLTPNEIYQISSMKSDFLDLTVSRKEAFNGSNNLMNYDLISVTNSLHVKEETVEKSTQAWLQHSSDSIQSETHTPRLYLNIKLTVSPFSTSKFSVMRREPIEIFTHYNYHFNAETSAGNFELIDSTAILIYGKSIWLEYPDSWKNGKQCYARVLVEEHLDKLTREKYYKTISWERYEPLRPYSPVKNLIRFY